jgi:Sulfotransferase family
MESNLLFICGFPSSGTDLLKNILNAHPDISIGGEFPFLPALCAKYGPLVRGNAVHEVIEDLKWIDFYHNFRNPMLTVLPTRQEHSLEEIYSLMLTTETKRWKGNKTPQNTENIGKLRVLFPNAKYILVVRDIRDVALSWQHKWGKDPLLCASKWDLRMRCGYRLLKESEKDRLIVNYESLLSEFESTVLEICSFLGIEFHSNMIEFARHTTEIIEGKLNYGQPILVGNHGKWRKEMDPLTVRRIEEIALPSLRSFDYSVPDGRSYRPITIVEKYLGIARDIYALLFVGNRAIQKNRFRNRLGTIVYELRKFILMRYTTRYWAGRSRGGRRSELTSCNMTITKRTSSTNHR